MMRVSNRNKGFTLIEILIVVAIIAILAAILFPVFARARENGRRASCASNVKQISLGIMQYAQDYDEKLPLFQTSGFAIGTTNGTAWSQQIQPYLNSMQIFQCPSEPNPSAAAGTNGAGYTDYGMATYCTIYNGCTSYSTGVALASFVSPSLSVMVFEMPNGAANNGYNGCTNWNCSGSANTPGKLAFAGPGADAQIHLAGENVGFADGHVKWMKGASKSYFANVYNGRTPVSTGWYTFSYSLVD